ncbi:uncharacterized protein LOC100831859 [Brachypodium distachyon]|uniref:uncharacterized protein LOC100831859 n=1 Tax=Brachypodium distachyon TaxID=15368 RepID=UPI000D0D765C|nr:uncharacterized protein LOC100831859 [Brachypodium distachyon]XP_024316888.1 uncharacterized protein LOC100831859 [Brachypodium distachyon]|eukprot:XP_014755954.2 uncharacterized protein LOC100831859 [Brachypodium distachyon]
MPPAPERWSILARIPKVIKGKEAKRTFPRGADVTVACADPPRASLLTVPFRVSPPPCIFNHPYVAAADGSSGLLLLSATEPAGEVTYHLCHARTGEATCLRPQSSFMVSCHGANVGLTVLGGGDGVVVAELQPSTDGSGRATLLCYTAGGYSEWAFKELAYSPPLLRQWFCEEVVSYGGMLWWVELSYGILACDPCCYTSLFPQSPTRCRRVNRRQVWPAGAPAAASR